MTLAYKALVQDAEGGARMIGTLRVPEKVVFDREKTCPHKKNSSTRASSLSKRLDAGHYNRTMLQIINSDRRPKLTSQPNHLHLNMS
jgi:hypothetical protein